MSGFVKEPQKYFMISLLSDKILYLYFSIAIAVILVELKKFMIYQFAKIRF
jgi:hypothetical protein